MSLMTLQLSLCVLIVILQQVMYSECTYMSGPSAIAPRRGGSSNCCRRVTRTLSVMKKNNRKLRAIVYKLQRTADKVKTKGELEKNRNIQCRQSTRIKARLHHRRSNVGSTAIALLLCLRGLRYTVCTNYAQLQPTSVVQLYVHNTVKIAVSCCPPSN